MKKEFQEKEEETNKKINEAVLKERKNLNTRQKMEIENIRKQHQKEIDVNILFRQTTFIIMFWPILDNS
jgi:molecular chaperone GrpE (heat shock protein)